MSIEAPLAQVSEGLSSSVFDISVPANIPADKSGHKVGRKKLQRDALLVCTPNNRCRFTWLLSI